MSLGATLSLTASNPALHTIGDTAVGTKATPEAKARAKATEFEQVYLSTMLNQMFAGLETSGPFHGGQAEETWRGLLVDRYAGEIARSGGIGLADSVYRQLLQVQEGSTK